MKFAPIILGKVIPHFWKKIFRRYVDFGRDFCYVDLTGNHLLIRIPLRRKRRNCVDPFICLLLLPFAMFISRYTIQHTSGRKSYSGYIWRHVKPKAILIEYFIFFFFFFFFCSFFRLFTQSNYHSYCVSNLRWPSWLTLTGRLLNFPYDFGDG